MGEDLYCAVCDHPFTYHKKGGECTVQQPDPWRSRWCDCSSYCAPRPPVESTGEHQ